MAMNVRPIEIRGELALIPLTQGKHAHIDVEDAEKVRNYNWCAIKDGNTFYAKAWIDGSHVMLHQRILQVPDGFLPDHIDRDGLNNRRSNLRVATRTQNQGNQTKSKRNTSGFKGVREAKWATGSKRWRASIVENHKVKHLGYFYTPEEAAKAYDDAAIEYFGDFATVNFGRV
jgi:hypothetical protein